MDLIIILGASYILILLAVPPIIHSLLATPSPTRLSLDFLPSLVQVSQDCIISEEQWESDTSALRRQRKLP